MRGLPKAEDRSEAHRCSGGAIVSEGWQHASRVQVQAQCQAQPGGLPSDRSRRRHLQVQAHGEGRRRRSCEKRTSQGSGKVGEENFSHFFQPPVRHFFRRWAPLLAAPPLAVGGGKVLRILATFFVASRGDAAREPGRPR